MWLEFHDSARDHPKILKLARDLQIEEAHALGLMGSLWAWSLRMAPDGDLSSFDVEDIEIGAKWTGQTGQFVTSATNRKLLDYDGISYRLHDWPCYARHLKAAEWKRAERARKKNKSQSTSTKCQTTSADKQTTSTDGGGGVAQTDRPTDQLKTDQTDSACARDRDITESELELEFDSNQLAEIIDDLSRARGLGPYTPQHSDYNTRQDAVERILAIARHEDEDPVEIARKSYWGFITAKDKWLNDNGYPLGVWAKKVGHYYKPPPPIDDEPSRASTYERDALEAEQKERKTQETLSQEDPEEALSARNTAKEIIANLACSKSLSTTEYKSLEEKMQNFQESREQLRKLSESEERKK